MGNSMLRRSWPVLALLVLPAVLAGCTSPEAAPAPVPDNAAPPARGDEGAAPAPAPAPSNGGAARPAPVKPTTEPVQASGDIAGPFQESWDIQVPAAGMRYTTVSFLLSGAQDGAPPTARVNLALLDPDGEPVASQLVGMGANSNVVEWVFYAQDLPKVGTYTLTASSQPDTSGLIPSAGFGKYALHAQVKY